MDGWSTPARKLETREMRTMFNHGETLEVLVHQDTAADLVEQGVFLDGVLHWAVKVSEYPRLSGTLLRVIA